LGQAPLERPRGKNERRNQIEKLTAANLTLKTKGRETAKALKTAEARIEVLEYQNSQTEAKAVNEVQEQQSMLMG
jgi:hypothetical protein